MTKTDDSRAGDAVCDIKFCRGRCHVFRNISGHSDLFRKTSRQWIVCRLEKKPRGHSRWMVGLHGVSSRTMHSQVIFWCMEAHCPPAVSEEMDLLFGLQEKSRSLYRISIQLKGVSKIEYVDAVTATVSSFTMRKLVRRGMVLHPLRGDPPDGGAIGDCGKCPYYAEHFINSACAKEDAQ